MKYCTNRIFPLFLALLGLPAAGVDFNMTDYGASGDGRILGTAAIQRTIDACSAAGGGRVVLPAGTFLSGPVVLKSQVELHLSPGALTDGARPEVLTILP